MSRTIIIGDLHGCLAEALDLFEAVALSRGDRVIFTGDLVDRGPDPRGAVELAMKHESILGNHEENHLARRRSHPSKLSPEHLRTRDALGDEHYAFFASLPLTLHLREHAAIVVHAGVDPRVPLHAQDPYHLLHVQCLRGDDRKSYWPSKAPPDARFWAESWRGPERIVFGHTVVHEPYLGEHVAAVDTGCAYGGRLTALVLPSWTFVSVRSRQTAKKPARVATFEVLPGVRCFS